MRNPNTTLRFDILRFRQCRCTSGLKEDRVAMAIQSNALFRGIEGLGRFTQLGYITRPNDTCNEKVLT
jgi:hypothetical protein